MKKFLFLFAASLIIGRGYAQQYDVLTYALNGTPVNGVKIKTNLPFTESSQMPTLIIEGYNYGTASPIGLLLTYYIYNGAFYSARLSSYGSYTPPIYLANEGGKVVIFIDSRDYYQRFSLRAFGRDRSAETATNYQGWTTADEALLGTAAAKLLVPYQNQFAGRVGIGTGNPQSVLHVGAPANSSVPAMRIGVPNDPGTTNVPVGSPAGGYNIDFYTWRDVRPDQVGARMRAERINTYNPGSALVQGMDLVFSTSNALEPTNLAERLRIKYNGNIGIGTNNPGSYKLAVEGIIGARKVKVTQATWADFVFHPEYQLLPLEKVKAFIDDNGHLPEVPSAKEVAAEGLDLGEMDKKLLQKIEELTLYVIEQHQKLKDQQELIRRLESEMSILKTKIQ